MIDTSIIRCISMGPASSGTEKQSGPVARRATSKIHAVSIPTGVPVRLAVTAGEAHDNRLAGKLLSRLINVAGRPRLRCRLIGVLTERKGQYLARATPASPSASASPDLSNGSSSTLSGNLYDKLCELPLRLRAVALEFDFVDVLVADRRTGSHVASWGSTKPGCLSGLEPLMVRPINRA
jgi:hypothetical protein